MASKDEIEAATIRTPRRGEVYVLAGTNTTQVFATPAEWFGLKVRIEAAGDDCWVQMAPDASISINPLAVTSLTGTQLNAANTGSGERVQDGTYKEFDLVRVDAYIGIRCTGTAGLVMIRASEFVLGA